uniref:Protein arginine N-methyltransferase n=1 Tax=Macrostomum lignano TaxID=282301 RepID=A0A1I8JFB7_9PLAT
LSQMSSSEKRDCNGADKEEPIGSASGSATAAAEAVAVEPAKEDSAADAGKSSGYSGGNRSKRGNSGRALCGIDLAFCSDQKAGMLEAHSLGYAFVCLPLFHPRNVVRTGADVGGHADQEEEEGQRHRQLDQLRLLPATRPDHLVIDSEDWTRFVVGKISAWIRCDSSWEAERLQSLAALRQELSWAAHIGLVACLIDLPDGGRVSNLARALLAFHRAERSAPLMWVRVPMAAEQVGDDGDIGNGDDGDIASNDPWLWWHRLCRLCDLILGQLGVALEVTADLPGPAAVQRWLAEPVKALVLPTSLFLTNQSGYPVLSKAHQALLMKFFRLQLQVIITGSCRHEKGIEYYQQYINWLYSRRSTDLYTSQGKGYEDTLQDPLQPLADNLHSATYQVFEMDPYKYRAYREAVRQALVEMVPDSEAESRLVTIAVLGAGRGPLVQECLIAGRQSGRRIRVFAVEKNGNAVNTLLNRSLSEWPDSVVVLPTDMRQLKPTDLQVTRQRDPEKPYYTFLETPYVVNLVNSELLAPPQPVFTFRHPAESAGPDGRPASNERYIELTYRAERTGVLHGFAGYFDSRLYGSVSMSILPEDHSPDLFSWFPLVFPLHYPVPVKCGDAITVAMWRVVSATAVWYEWALLAPVVLPIHNAGGRSFTINLY